VDSIAPSGLSAFTRTHIGSPVIFACDAFARAVPHQDLLEPAWAMDPSPDGQAAPAALYGA
jgi:hypothetical protein